MNHPDPAPNDAWHVQLPTGEARVMTLDQLDEAFQQGLVQEDTLVRADGAAHWAKLGEIAGIESPTPDSMMPVAVKMSETDDAPVEFRSGKRNVVVGLAVAALVLVGAVVAVTRVDAGPSAAERAAAAGPGMATWPKSDNSLTDEERAAIRLKEEQKFERLKAEKKLEEKRKANAQPTRAVPGQPKAKTDGTFHEGGNEHDPLNAKL